MINPKTRKMTVTALMAAAVFVVTFLLPIPMPFAPSGYFNFGDVLIYLAAYMLGGPCGAVAGGLGAALADLVVFPTYALPTAVIKGLMGLTCGKLMRGGDLRRFVLSSTLGGAIMVVGYALFEWAFLFGFDIRLTLLSALQNLIQWGGCVAIASAAFPAVRRLPTI